jgi:hypothetical protein
MPVKPATTRIIGIDVARSCAIFLAMGSHVWVVSNAGDFFHGGYVDALKLLMALATPTFIVLFGTMLEVVYLPRFDVTKRSVLVGRLWSRAIQCWLLYSLSIVVLFLVQSEYSFFFSLSTIIMLGVTPFTDILKFYAIALAVAPLLLWARNRFGLTPLLAIAVAVHLLHPVLRSLPSPVDVGLPTEADRLAMFLFGIGGAKLGGPSVLHGMTLVIFGMALGRILLGARTGDPGSLVRRAWIVLLGAGIPLVAGALFVDIETRKGLGNMAMRMDSHPLYFMAGILGAYAVTAATVLVTQRTTDRSAGFWRSMTFFGRTSLFTFAFGNMLLYCIQFEPATPGQSALLGLLLMTAITLLSFCFDWAARKDGAFAKTVSGTQNVISRLAARLSDQGAQLYRQRKMR